jgi:hypothetical protein
MDYLTLALGRQNSIIRYHVISVIMVSADIESATFKT